MVAQVVLIRVRLQDLAQAEVRHHDHVLAGHQAHIQHHALFQLDHLWDVRLMRLAEAQAEAVASVAQERVSI